MSEVEARMVQRRHHMKQTCKVLGLDASGNDSLHRPNPWEFLVNRPYHLVWCNVFKAASTSWMYNFNILAGYKPKFLKNSKLVPLNLARRRYPRPSLHALQEALNDSIAFLIVRHPLERLLSAYRDKIQFSLPHTLHRKLGNEIVLKYRKGKQKVCTIINPQLKCETFQSCFQYNVSVTYKKLDKISFQMWNMDKQQLCSGFSNILVAATIDSTQNNQSLPWHKILN